MNKENIKLVGHINIKHIRDGKVIGERDIHNLITTVGKALLAGRLNGVGAPAAATYLALGVGTNAAAAGDTTLQTEITDSGLERAAATAALATTTTTNDTATLTKTWTATGSKAVTEVGAFNASSSGTLLGRRVFSAVNVVSADQLQVAYSFVIS